MRSSHDPRRTAVAALLVMGALLLPALALAGPATATASPTPALPASAAPAAPLPSAPVAAASSAVVRFQDYALPEGQTVESVVVIHGDAVIGGTVTRDVVVLAGDATIESTAVVGAGQPGQSSSVVVVDGHLTVEPGATVYGKTTQVAGLHAGGLARAAASGVALRPIGVLAGWWQLLFLPIVALVVSALFPQTTQRVGRRVSAAFWPSLGWGFVGLLVSVVLLVVLAVTIVGLLVAVPAVFALIAGSLFCTACVAAALGRLVLSGSERYRDNLIAAAVVGAVLVSLVSLVPVLGGVALFLATVAGLGAALTLLNEWRVGRRPVAAPAGGPAGHATPPSAPRPPYAPAPVSGGAAPYGQGLVPPYGGPAAPCAPGSAPGPMPASGWAAPPAGWAAQGPPPGWGAPPPGWTPAPGSPGWTSPYGAPGWTPPYGAGGWRPGPPPWWAPAAPPSSAPMPPAQPPAVAPTDAPPDEASRAGDVPPGEAPRAGDAASDGQS